MMTDIPSMAACNLAVLPENYDTEFYREHLRQAPGLSQVAFDPSLAGGGKVVGYILAKLETDKSNQEYAWVTSLGVYPTHRRLGVARRLMEASHSVMNDRYHVSYSMLHVRISNKPAYHLYHVVNDYKQYKVEPRYYEDGEDAYEMRKDTRIITHYDKRHSAHALALTSVPYPGKSWKCDACGAPGIGPSYHCGECSYDMHITCARPVPISTTLVVGHHSCVLTLTMNPYGHGRWKCDVCYYLGEGHSYQCHTCGFDMHPVCVSRPVLPRADIAAPHVLTIGTPQHTSTTPSSTSSSSPSLSTMMSSLSLHDHKSSDTSKRHPPVTQPTKAIASAAVMTIATRAADDTK